MKLDFACCVDRGIRPTNDDRALVAGQITDTGETAGSEPAPLLAAVCDGCGGYAGGGIAARTVLEALASCPADALADPVRLMQALRSARDAVFARKAQNPELTQMCTTIAGCLFTQEQTLIFHAGDSRVYRYDGFGLTRMTLDHSVVQELVSMGALTEEEARLDPARSIITRCIGVECPDPELYVSRSPIAPGEIYLLCSDGLWDYVQEQQLMALLAIAEGDLALTARRMVELALEQGSNDNITVLLCAYPGSLSLPESTPFILD